MPPRSSAALIGLALAAPLAVCAALSAARGTVESDNAVLVLVLVVVGVAASGSRLAGVVAALSSAAWFDYFLTRPFHHFTIADRDDVETAVLLTLVGIAVTEIALWGRRQQARLSVREGYLTGVISAADLVARGEAPPKVVLDFVGRQIVDLLSIDSCT
jgi:K+-sensing histidine kinase KdpD